MRKLSHPYIDPAPLFRHGGASLVGRREVLDFSVNINPLGPPASVLAVLRRELPAIACYPDPSCRALTERIAAEHSVTPDAVVIGNGSNELIYAIARAFRPRRVAVAEPTYTEYLRASLLVGAEVNHWLAEGDHFDFQPFDPEGADLVWLCNPNNPTGGLWPSASRTLVPWIERHPRTLFVVDEAFMALCFWSFPHQLPPADASLIPALNRLSNLIVLRSLTKVYAIPGVRLGYAITSPDLGKALSQQLVPWSVNVLAQHAGLAALTDSEYLVQTHKYLFDQLFPPPTSEGFTAPSFSDRFLDVSPCLHPLTSLTNFTLVRLESIASNPLCSGLAERGIVVRNAANFVGLDDHFIRVAIRSPEDNARLFKQLRSVLAEEGSICPAHS